jgi:hypothetical protein
MAHPTHCEKCRHRLYVDSFYGKPERLRCPICGFSIWFAPAVVMKEIPEQESRFAGNQWTKNHFSHEEMLARRRESQRRYRQSLKERR